MNFVEHFLVAKFNRKLLAVTLLIVYLYSDCLSITFRKPNIFDNMVSILEKHASNLEKQVAERTRLLTEEKKKTDALLSSMLPR